MRRILGQPRKSLIYQHCTPVRILGIFSKKIKRGDFFEQKKTKFSQKTTQT